MQEYAKGVGISVALSVVFGLVGVLGLYTILEGNPIAGVPILLASVVFWAFACFRTDLAEALTK